MGITVKSRESYQPVLKKDGQFAGGERNYAGRLRILEREIDFTDKTVLDLGCSGGFFSFSVAHKARSVIAVDADTHIIANNNAAAKQHGFENISFLCREIGEELLNELPNFDIVLFMSVFHHFISTSQTYDWSSGANITAAFQTLSKIRNLADTFVFETGHSDEGFDWCHDIAALSADSPSWVNKHVFGSSFRNVKILRGYAYSHFPFNAAPWLRRVIPVNRYSKKLLRMMGVDIRDFRNIYVGDN